MNEIAVQNFGVSDMERMARAFAQSKLFGVQTPEQALALCLIAQAEGRHPASAAADYHIVNNRPSKKAEAMLRDFILSGGKVEWHALDDTQADATFTHPQGGQVRINWDMERKKQAGINNPMWAKFPRQMLRSRCVSEGVRTVCPAATSGMYEPEEAKETYTAPPAQLRDVTPPKRARQEPALSPPDPEMQDIDPPADMDTPDTLELIELDIGDAGTAEQFRGLAARLNKLKKADRTLDGLAVEALRQRIHKLGAEAAEQEKAA